MKIENDAAFGQIMNAEYLTQRMSSSGAQDYLASVTYTLTENRQINKVNFIYEEDDNAMPVYTGRLLRIIKLYLRTTGSADGPSLI
jgi:hypothetical protein